MEPMTSDLVGEQIFHYTMVAPYKRFFFHYMTTLFHFPTMYLCKFGQSPPTGSVDRVLEMLLLTVLIGW